MAGLIFYIFDLETTGLSSKIHEIDEISIIRCSDRTQLTTMVRCDNPERANYDALKVTGKTVEDLCNGISKEEAVSLVDKFLEEDGATSAHRCFIGHKVITFDKKFIHAMYSQVGKELPVDLWMDTWEMMKHYVKSSGLKDEAKKKGEKISLTLQASCELMGIKKFSQAHSSKFDTRNNYLLYKHLIEDKQIDYLPFIKTFVHNTSSADNENDLELLDL